MNSRFQLSSSDVERIKREVLEGVVETTKLSKEEIHSVAEPLSFNKK